MSLAYPFLINIIPAIFRNDILSSNKKGKNKSKKKKPKNQTNDTEYAYKTSQWLQLL